MKSIIFFIGLLIVTALNAQNFSFEEFVGTWNGTSYSENVPSWNASMTLVVEEDGHYTDSSGLLMPTIYPNTQQVEYEESTNRIHFWYLGTVYAGIYFYDHFFYEVTYYNGATLHLEYNYWDDPEPNPNVQLIILNREGGIPNGTIEGIITDFDSGYPIEGANILLGANFTESDENGFYNIVAAEGMYDLTIIVDGHYNFNSEVEIIENDVLEYNIGLQHMYNPPENLTYQINRASVSLQWEEPVGMNLEGYHIYRDSEIIGFTYDLNYLDSELTEGLYTYSIAAIYGNYESSHSNQVSVEILNPTDTENDFIAASTELIGNYPNPFNPSTNIKFVISESGHVNLDIYNSKGQKVKTLIDENMNSGEHSILWNGKDETGKNVSSGIYFTKIRKANYIATRKMILMK